MILRKTQILNLVALLVACAAAGAQETPGPRPAVLVDNWGGSVDTQYMQYLSAQGLVLDAITHDQLTWERLQQYNVLVLMDFPQRDKVTVNYGGGPASGPNLADTLALIDRFLQAGGGVMIDLIQHGNDVTFYNTAQEALARWGARRPLETITVTESQLAQHPRLRVPFYFTDQVLPSPVSEGVKGVWYPQGGAWTYMTGPVDVDDKWTVVLRAPRGSRTEPIPLPERKPGIPYYDEPFVRPGGVSEPPLFAIRDLQPGRLALFHCSPIFHLGSGLSWMHQGALLNAGLQNRPSDFGRLLENTFRWLAEPSLGKGDLGGAEVPADRWIPPLQRPDAKAKYDGNWLRGPEILLPDAPAPPANLLRGIIGPRTALSGGKGTVAEYAAVARQKNLGFIIFLEDFAELTREELAQLAAECKANSGDDLALYAGYRIKSNIGNTLFFFGADPLYVTDDHLTGPNKKLFKLQGEDKEGKFVAGNSIDFIFQSLRADVNSVGYYDFTRVADRGAMQPPHLRLYSMCGVMFYDHGKLIEDVTDQYLLTNQGTLPGIPVSINLVDSPQEMATEVDSGRALTYAAAPGAKQVWDYALRWNHQYFGCNVFPSTGPRILSWPGTYRTSAFAGENFVTWRNLLGPRLWVTAEAGLKEVALYDGEKLWRRFLPGGAKELNVRLYFSGALQRNISAVATDMAGGKAVTFPLRGWNDGSPAPVFCGDHVNDCGGMRLFRGPGWSLTEWVPTVPNAGDTWDGGPPAALALFGLGQWNPALDTDKGRQDGNHYQIPLLGFTDEKVTQCHSRFRWIMLPGVPHNNPWSGYGPLQPNPLFDTDTAFTLWWQGYEAEATGWGAHGKPFGPCSTLYDQVVTYKQDVTVKSFAQSGLWRSKLPVPIVLLIGKEDELLFAREVSPFTSPGTVSYVIPTGGWWAGVSPGEANAQLHVNYGAPLRLALWDDGRNSRMEIWADVPAAGLAVRKGEQHHVSVFSMAWPMETKITDSDALLRWVRYLQKPDGMEILRGSRREGPVGIVELQAQNGAVEMKVPQPQGLDPALPCRVSGLNPRWSTLLWQYQGYNGGNRYGPPTSRVRALGVDSQGRAYFPVYAGRAPLTHVLVGQPVVADAAGKDVFIEVVCLEDAQGEKPPLWHVSVNNPLDKPVTTTLRKAMDLPGLTLPEEALTLAAGEYRRVVHQAE